ncbi:hypothetical protein APT98_16835 [Klebsiella quasipneumoniae]|nr:hypothetical protein APT98_16835 [Klebsiella quasipneumoniae]
MYRSRLAASVSGAVIAHFFAGIVRSSQHPNRTWRKKQRDAV